MVVSVAYLFVRKPPILFLHRRSVRKMPLLFLGRAIPPFLTTTWLIYPDRRAMTPFLVNRVFRFYLQRGEISSRVSGWFRLSAAAEPAKTRIR